MAVKHEHWSSRWAFMLAAVGSAVGLGNIWKFPYEAGSGGGGAFVLIYLFFIFVVGVPVMMAELSLGRRGQMSPIGSMKKIAAEEKRSPLWGLVGWGGVVGAFIVISFYSVIGGWTLAYVVKSAMGFAGMTAEQAGVEFGEFISDPFWPIICHAAFMAITILIVNKGVKGGLEKAVTYLMPALFVMLLILVIYAAVAGDFASAVEFLFYPDFSKVTPDVTINALGQAFFSLSLALGSIMTYGSYLSKDVHLGKSAFTIASADSAVALLAGLAIFPIVFAFNVDPAGGPGLVFVSLPIAFGEMPFGVVVGTLFFALLGVAAITSSISLLEPSVSYLEHSKGIDRKKATLWIGAAAFALGVLSAYSQGGNFLSDIRFFGLDIMGVKDYLTNNIIMPLGGMFTALFVGWFVSRKTMMEELALTDESFRIWYFLVRFIAPVAVTLVFISVTIGF
ncbi:transporter [Kordiimonas sediminis]|uniref:Transporter n=1 Tax=Kordiimonas sediminis TaxID=1735581 RepID=A0A919E5N1_9PROT|nr:sodium-dependent transporter [Kordiimonas sediminis]GHF16435.1 transporter [Kordiimonas sediminis]